MAEQLTYQQKENQVTYDLYHKDMTSYNKGLTTTVNNTSALKIGTFTHTITDIIEHINGFDSIEMICDKCGHINTIIIGYSVWAFIPSKVVEIINNERTTQSKKIIGGLKAPKKGTLDLIVYLYLVSLVFFPVIFFSISCLIGYKFLAQIVLLVIPSMILYFHYRNANKKIGKYDGIYALRKIEQIDYLKSYSGVELKKIIRVVYIKERPLKHFITDIISRQKVFDMLVGLSGSSTHVPTKIENGFIKPSIK